MRELSKRILFSVAFLCLFTYGVEGASAPFSLKYDGKLMTPESFPLKTETLEQTQHYDAWRGTYTAPDGKLQVVIDGRRYKNYPVCEYAVTLKNLSETEPTKIVSEFQTLDFNDPLTSPGASVTLQTLRGSQCVTEDFSPVSVALTANHAQRFATASGRSSNEFMPFIELNHDETRGKLFAIGWTGHWAANFRSDSENVRVSIGMGNTHFKLLPGESVIQPSVTIFSRESSTRREFQTLVHRFMLEHKVPRDAEGKIIPPILAVACGGGNKTPKMMHDILNYVIENKIPLDTYWIDAGWYGAPHEDELYSNCGPNWYKYVGDWRVNTTTHPSGTLLPIADAVHKQGMKLLLWFEPERAHEGAPILAEHPEYFHRNLLDLGNPEARKWISDTVFEMIEKHDINIYRQDFNMDPGGIWAELDQENPERVGIAEAKHIAGLYGYMDEMRTKFPGILQENCASGGRRLDIEMLKRAHAYCRSDYFIGQKPNDTAFILGQNATHNTIAYLPFQGCEFNCVPVHDDYAALSIISTGTVVTFSDFDGGILRREISEEETRWFRKIFVTAARMKDFYTGDFYPLCEPTAATNDLWCGWQFDRKDLNAGFALIFRRENAPESASTFELGNIDVQGEYDLEFYDGTKKIVSGKNLQTLQSTLKPRSFLLVFYKKRAGK